MGIASENGWQPAKVGQESLTWFTVPGTTVNLQTMSGWPMLVMRAFAADYNAFVEPLRDADSASWTPTNSVATSNHLNGTAMDLNWGSHPFQVKGTFNTGQMKTIRDLLDFYEGMIFWAGDWSSPIDEMHWQLGYGTFNNPDMGSFITRKIRSDGYSTFRRGPTEAGTVVDRTDGYALAVMAEGRRRGISQRGITIALATCLVESNMLMYANASVPESLTIPHDAVGSDHDSLGLFQQRCPMWGPATCLMDPTCSAGLFFDELDKYDYDSTVHSPGWYAQAVQRSAYPDRYDQRYAEAQNLYARLSTTPDTGGGLLMALSDAEQREVLDLLRQQAGYRRISRSPLRHVGETETETIAGFAWNTDGSVHVLLIELLARLGDPDALNLLREVAGMNPARYPERAHDRNLAQAILNSLAGVVTVESAPPTGLTPGLAPAPVVATAPVIQNPVVTPPERPVDTPEPIPVVVTPPAEGGGVQSQIDALNSELSALRGVLSGLTQQMKG